MTDLREKIASIIENTELCSWLDVADAILVISAEDRAKLTAENARLTEQRDDARRSNVHWATTRRALNSQVAACRAEALEEAAQFIETHNQDFESWMAMATAIRALIGKSAPVVAESEIIAALQAFDTASCEFECDGETNSPKQALEAAAAWRAKNGGGAQRRWRHVKRGTEYAEIGRGKLQTDTPLSDYAELVVYQCDDGAIWVRPVTEFEDGRFVEIGA